MSFFDLALAVFAGNAMTIWFGAGLWQFHKHDYRAPWWAYGAFMFPLLMVLSTLYLTEVLPRHSAEAAPLQSSATNP